MRNLGLLLIAVFLLPIRGYAVLGEAADQTIHTLTSAVTKRSGVSIRYLDHSESHVTVREYAGSDNKVFAVKWRGQGRPNLAVLLGKFHAEYRVATSMPGVRIPRRGLAAVSDNLEILSYGTMSNMHGYIIWKGHLPPNVKADELP